MLVSSAMRITVITPVRNGIAHMEHCLRNVAGQECREAEHLVIDGGSRDGTKELLAESEGEIANFRWISLPGSSQSQAMNRGIREAKGDILSFLNVDDTYAEGVLQRVVEMFASLPVPSLVAGYCAVRDSRGRVLFVNRPTLDLVEILAGAPFPANPSAYFYHRSLHERTGPYEEDPFCMDLIFLLRAIPHAHCVLVKEYWGNFHLGPGTKTFAADADGRERLQKQAIFDETRKHLGSEDEARLTSLLRRRRLHSLWMRSRLRRLLRSSALGSFVRFTVLGPLRQWRLLRLSTKRRGGI